MVMVGGLERKLSKLIGKDNNRNVSFIEAEKVVAVFLKDGTLVKIPVTPKGNSMYMTETREERLKVYTASGVIQVTNRRWTVLSRQTYETQKDGKYAK